MIYVMLIKDKSNDNKDINNDGTIDDNTCSDNSNDNNDFNIIIFHHLSGGENIFLFI